MNRRIQVRLMAAWMPRLLIAFTPLLLAGRAFNANGQTLTVIHPFAGSPNDGAFPYAGLAQGSDGNFYGTTTQGGNTNLFFGAGEGTVFRISPSGSFTNLYSFNFTDGANPEAGLVQGSDGNFYGTTEYGGNLSYIIGYGTVFRISPSGNLTTLYAFSGIDGAFPYGGLVEGSDSNFYGTTRGGGTRDFGTVFRISPSGSFTNLHLFNNSDGALPYAGLVQGGDGNFYGTTASGGNTNLNNGNGLGTVFRISPGGSLTTLYAFGTGDGAYPSAGLVQGSDGNFYGTTTEGGNTNSIYTRGEGTVFRISPSGSFTNLHLFNNSDGALPYAGLVQGSDGNFYGATQFGGTNLCGCGMVFRISPNGSLTTVYSFSHNDGQEPQGGLVQGSDGNFYGTAYNGGNNTYGTVFKLSVPLNPPPWPINQITGVQPSGSDIVFNIPSVAGETYQLQFTTDPSSGIWSNVPGVSVTNSIGALLTLTNSGGAVGPQGFYRFAITP